MKIQLIAAGAIASLALAGCATSPGYSGGGSYNNGGYSSGGYRCGRLGPGGRFGIRLGVGLSDYVLGSGFIRSK